MSKDELLSQIDQIDLEINQLDCKMEELTQKKEELQKSRTKIESEYKSLIARENTYSLLQKVKNISNDDIVEHWLERDTKTVALVDDYIKSNANHLILNTDMIYYFGYDLGIETDFKFDCQISYIIIKKYPRIYYNLNTTLTELKALNKGKYRLYENTELSKQIHSAIHEFFVTTNIDGKNIIREDINLNDHYFDIPLKSIVLLRAQSSKNRTGYGNIYNGETLISEGTNYGDTTNFLIVGVRLSKRQSYSLEF